MLITLETRLEKVNSFLGFKFKSKILINIKEKQESTRCQKGFKIKQKNGKFDRFIE